MQCEALQLLHHAKVMLDESVPNCDAGPCSKCSDMATCKAVGLMRAIESQLQGKCALEAERDKDLELLDKAAGYIAWSSGASDFQPNGKARSGWRKLGKPTLQAIENRLRAANLLPRNQEGEPM